MFKKFLALAVLSLCVAPLSAAERDEERPCWSNPSGRIKVSGISLHDLTILRNTTIQKDEFHISMAEVSIEQKEPLARKAYTKVTFHFGHREDDPSDRTIVVPQETIVTHVAADGTKTTFKANETHISDKEMERQRKAKQLEEDIKRREKEAIAIALQEDVEDDADVVTQIEEQKDAVAPLQEKVALVAAATLAQQTEEQTPRQRLKRRAANKHLEVKTRRSNESIMVKVATSSTVDEKKDDK